MSGLADDSQRLVEIAERVLTGEPIEDFDLGEYEICVVAAYTERRLEAQRDELETFLHSYLMDNEPQVTPRGLADAVMLWLYRQEAAGRAAEQEA